MERSLAGRFRLEDKLGGDDVSEVHRGRDVRDDRAVRIHLVRLEAGSRRERVLREAKRAARVRHPGFLAILDVGRTDDDEAFIVTEEPSGEPLDAHVARGGVLGPRAAAALAAQVCRSLAIAHDAGVVHRDLRPSRVYVTGEGERAAVVVQGLGVPHASAVRDDAYVAPEQRRGEPPGRRADVYSIGAMLHVILTGSAPPPTPSLEGPLGPVVAKCLAADPRDRYLDAVELETALRLALDPVQRVSISPVSAMPPASKPPSPRPAPSSKPPRSAASAGAEARSHASSRPDAPANDEKRAPAAPPPRALGRPLAPRSKWEDAALDLLDGPAPRVVGAAVVAFVLARIMTSSLLPWILALAVGGAAYASWRMSRSSSGGPPAPP